MEISQEEGGHGVSVVRLVLFRLTQTVQEDEREAGVRERGERPEDGLAEDGGWLGGTLAGVLLLVGLMVMVLALNITRWRRWW